jgi:TonB-linked SusC/RagA family outer membrane protein
MKLYPFKPGMPLEWLPPKIFLIMRLVIIIMIAGFVQVSAASFGQKLSYTKKDASLREIFKQITLQTGYNVLYSPEKVEASKKLSVDFKNTDLKAVLEKLSDESFVYSIEDKNIIIKPKEPSFLDRVVDTFTPPVDISGLVLDEKGLPLPGVTVRVKGSGKATSTGNDGKFYLAGVDDDAVIEIRMLGYKVLELSAKSKFDGLRMEQITNNLDETIVVAYGTSTKRSNTGSLTVVKGEEVQNLPSRSVDKSLQGLVPGLLVTSGSGQPGSGLSNFVLRGIATGDNGLSGSTVRNPLIVVDGMPVTQESSQSMTPVVGTTNVNPMAQLNPSDIESITVLKDAAAVALYGSKAGNGVILITTKRGKLGKTTINFNHQTDISSGLQGNTKLVSPEEYIELLYETFRNTTRLVGGVSTQWTDPEILAELKRNFPVRSNGSLYPQTNWMKEVYNNRAITLSNNLSFSGGNDKSNFYLNFEYTKQKGIARGTGYDRKSVRFNFENRPSEWFKVGLNSTLSYNLQDYLSQTFNDPGGALGITPLNPVRVENGELILSYTFPYAEANPVAARMYHSKKNTTYRSLSKIYGEVSFFEHLKFTSNLGLDFGLTESNEKIDPRVYDNESSSIGIGRVQDRDFRNANLISTNMLRFDKQIAKGHSLNILIGQEVQIQTNKFLDGILTGLQVPTDDQISNGGTKSSAGLYTKQTQLSYFGQANYGYREKYFISASIRNDGYSRFGERNRKGTYWSAGAGWIITAEPFMKETITWLDYLKIRGSLGDAGNSFAINRLTRFDVLKYSGFLAKPAVVHIQPGNPDIKWEQTFTIDVGLEARLLNNRLSFAADYYKRKTNDLIYNVTLAPSSGFGSVADNLGDMKNTGLEFSLSADIFRKNAFGWNISGNWSTNKNILVKANLPLTAVTGNTLANEVGRNFNSFYLVRWAGVNQETGLAQWFDGDGKVTTIYPSGIQHRQFTGKPQPDGFGALTNTFSYKGIKISAMLYYQYGYQIYNVYSLTNDGRLPYMNQDKRALDRWQKAGDIAANPKRTLNNADGSRASTRYLSDGDHIRLQNITLSYMFPAALIRSLHLSSLKIYAQGQNLALWTKFPGGDPNDTNVQGTGDVVYPNQATFSVGCNVTF